MKIWLDDIRNAPEGWVWLATPKAIITMTKNHWGEITDISLDHDLGKNVKTGYDYLNWLEMMICKGNLSIQHLPHITIHSMNPVGVVNMKRVLAKLDFMKFNYGEMNVCSDNQIH